MSRHYERAGLISVEEVFSLMDRTNVHSPVIFHNHIISVTSKRLKNFKLHGTKCMHCGVQGMYFSVERCKSSTNENDWHLNLYSLTYKLKEILLTRDHIIPKSKGGSDLLDNSQTLCEKCNIKKADKLPNVAIEWFNTTTDAGDSTSEDNLARLCRID